MLHKIRRAMRDRDYTYQLAGIVGIDDSFFNSPTQTEGGGKRGRGTSKNSGNCWRSTHGDAVGFANITVVDKVDCLTVEHVIKNRYFWKQNN